MQKIVKLLVLIYIQSKTPREPKLTKHLIQIRLPPPLTFSWWTDGFHSNSTHKPNETNLNDYKKDFQNDLLSEH